LFAQTTQKRKPKHGEERERGERKEERERAEMEIDDLQRCSLFIENISKKRHSKTYI